MPTPLTTDQEAVFSVAGYDDSVPPAQKPVSGTAIVSGYPGAYVARVGQNELHFVAQQPGSYTVTINATSQDGTALPVVTLDFTVTAPPVPQATHVTATDPIVKNKDITTPGDPGSNTVSFSV